MGACFITRKASGKNMQEAFQKLVEIADEEYGNDPYNGEINNCRLQRDLTDVCKDLNAFQKYAEENSSKREVFGFCIEKPVANNNKIKTTVNRFPQKGTRKWETYYEAVRTFSEDCVVSDINLIKCIEKARQFVEKNPDVRLKIIITKRLVGSDNKCAEIEYKKAPTEKLGTYYFAGYAPE